MSAGTGRPAGARFGVEMVVLGAALARPSTSRRLPHNKTTAVWDRYVFQGARAREGSGAGDSGPDAALDINYVRTAAVHRRGGQLFLR